MANPVKDMLLLENMGTIDAVEVYSMAGQLVYRQSVGSEKAAISLQKLAAGIYIATADTNGKAVRTKVVKD